MFLAIIVFIIILGVLVFVHELGHFITARRNGIKAEEFGFGFPPRIFGFIKDEKTGKYKFVPGNKEIKSQQTVYSINWIPLGGFVRIKGENGGNKEEKDSFAGKSAWIRIKVLAAGVTMNFILAWILISIVFMIGAPETVGLGSGSTNLKIQIASVANNSPASLAKLKVGDEIFKTQKNLAGKKIDIKDIKDLQKYINTNKGRKITLTIKRGNEKMQFAIVPRIKTPKNQGSLGISLVETSLVKYSWYNAIWTGLKTTGEITWAILIAFGGIIKGLFLGQGVGADVAGPVGIAVMTKQVTEMGISYILQFAALLSINLGIINILPIPALDGGRILFILIEKIKGSPVNQKLEQTFHTVGFLILILLLIVVSFRDVLHIIH